MGHPVFPTRKVRKTWYRVKNTSFNAIFKIQLSVFHCSPKSLMTSQLIKVIEKVLNFEKFQIVPTFFAKRYNLRTSFFYNFK